MTAGRRSPLTVVPAAAAAKTHFAFHSSPVSMARADRARAAHRLRLDISDGESP